jgi:hypothetical protein
MAGSDVRYPLPGRDRHALVGTFAPEIAGLPPTARAAFVDLADRPELREIAGEWPDRIEVHTAATQDRPADALLIRPDAHIAWAAVTDESADSAAPALREALHGWLGAP